MWYKSLALTNSRQARAAGAKEGKDWDMGFGDDEAWVVSDGIEAG